MVDDKPTASDIDFIDDSALLASDDNAESEDEDNRPMPKGRSPAQAVSYHSRISTFTNGALILIFSPLTRLSSTGDFRLRLGGGGASEGAPDEAQDARQEFQFHSQATPHRT